MEKGLTPDNDPRKKESFKQKEESTKSTPSSKPKSGRRNFLPVILGTTIVVAILMALKGYLLISGNQSGMFRQSESRLTSLSNTSLMEDVFHLTPENLQESISSAVAAVRPAVVYIVAERVQSKASTGGPQGGVSFASPIGGSTEEQQSAGSGVIIDQRGYIITNYHVVANAISVKVTPFGIGNEVYPAEIIMQIEKEDLAVLKISLNRALPVAKLGNSDMIEVGDLVLAIGSPFGLEQTVTLGIISDDKRDMIIDGRQYEDLIQTDAAINSGNSGGALVNIRGEVIGINTAIYAPTGVFNGVGFAIPINKVKLVLNQLFK